MWQLFLAVCEKRVNVESSLEALPAQRKAVLKSLYEFLTTKCIGHVFLPDVHHFLDQVDELLDSHEIPHFGSWSHTWLNNPHLDHMGNQFDPDCLAEFVFFEDRPQWLRLELIIPGPIPHIIQNSDIIVI